MVLELYEGGAFLLLLEHKLLRSAVSENALADPPAMLHKCKFLIKCSKTQSDFIPFQKNSVSDTPTQQVVAKPVNVEPVPAVPQNANRQALVLRSPQQQVGLY